MPPLLDIVILATAGAAGGFLAGLVGVGGGIIYGPVLLYYFRSVDIDDPLLTPLVLGTSLFCVWAAALSGAHAQWKKGVLDMRVAAISGLAASVVVILTSALITTQPWYDRFAFQLIMGGLLLWVSARMLMKPKRRLNADGTVAARRPQRRSAAVLIGIGAVTGVLVAAAGVGGGVLLIPFYLSIVRLPTMEAAATSLGAILIIATVGVGTYMVLGIGSDNPAGAVGYVDVARGILLVVPALAAARYGVRTAHRAGAGVVRISFAIVAGLIALRMLYEVAIA